MWGSCQANGGRYRFFGNPNLKKIGSSFLEVIGSLFFFLESFSIPSVFLGCHFGAELLNKDNISSAQTLNLITIPESF